jgi:hypothetical protein
MDIEILRTFLCVPSISCEATDEWITLQGQRCAKQRKGITSLSTVRQTPRTEKYVLLYHLHVPDFIGETEEI